METTKMQELAARLAAMSEAQRAEMAARMPVMTIQQHAISARNTCLIALQTAAPVTIIGGFRQWLAANRCVRKGEKAFYVLRPAARGRTADESAAPDDAEAPAGAPGDGLRFVPVAMFDVSQTDELPATVHH